MTNLTKHDIINVQTKEREERKMTKFEKVAKRAELLEVAYKAILDRDKWDNYVDAWAENPELIEDKIEEHEFYLGVLKEIEKML